MHGGHAAEDEPMAEMNLIPLIDIALTLLIIMMVTTVFIRRPGVNLILPKTVTREGLPETAKDLTIAVSAAGDMYANGVKSTDDEVLALLRALALRDIQGRVVVKGDSAVPYARIMSVLDMARQAKLTHIDMATDPKSTPNSTAPATTPPTNTGPNTPTRNTTAPNPTAPNSPAPNSASPRSTAPAPQGS